jgi:hypothetical protein
VPYSSVTPGATYMLSATIVNSGMFCISVIDEGGYILPLPRLGASVISPLTTRYIRAPDCNAPPVIYRFLFVASI